MHIPLVILLLFWLAVCCFIWPLTLSRVYRQAGTVPPKRNVALARTITRGEITR